MHIPDEVALTPEDLMRINDTPIVPTGEEPLFGSLVDSSLLTEQTSSSTLSFINAVQTLVWSLLAHMSLLDWVKISLAIFILVFVIVPVLQYLHRWINSLCKPIMFSYQHVLITGCGTGLGRSLAQGIFTRGAVITMIGKDE